MSDKAPVEGSSEIASHAGESSDSINLSRKPMCKFGRSCYRRQPSHFLEFSHPFVEGIARKINAGCMEEVIGMELDSPVLEQAQLVAGLLHENETVSSTKRNRSPSVDKSSKRVKSDDSTSDLVLVEDDDSVATRVDSQSCHYFLSSIKGIPETKKQPGCLTFCDIFDASLGTLESSVQFNFMVELGWLLAQYCYHKLQRKPLLVVYGAESEELREAPKLVPTMQTVRVKPKYPFGHHHTKMAILSYDDGSLRIVIHTGNLIESDWENRTQGLWISPRCPSSPEPRDSVTGFQKDLVRYLKAYPVAQLGLWIDKILHCDMSAIKVCFLPSVPGSHSDGQSKLWGHPYLNSLLREHATVDESEDGTVVIQCSSIGSLGSNPQDWLQGEIGYAMAACHGTTKAQFPSIKVVYPCHEDVMSSLDGIHGGGCLPYSRQGHSKQTWFTSFLHRWRSENLQRTRSMPHIKSYVRVSRDFQRASWFVLSSANLSKAAWGMKTKSSSLMIQSYEAGVLFLPKFLNGSAAFKISRELHLPYDLPLTRYGPGDQPWFIDHLRFH